MAHKRSFNSILPKQIKLKRTSVSCNSSAQWTNAFYDLSAPVGQRRSFRRISNELLPTDSLALNSDECTVPDVSPASSPEDELFTYSGHEFLSITSANIACKPLNPTDDRISDYCSSPSSQNFSQQSDCASNVDSNIVQHIPTPIHEFQRNSGRGTSTIEYLNQLKYDTSEIPFISLVGANVREKQSKDRLDVVDRLHTLHRRLNSERSIWLHQRVLGRETALSDRKTKLFRITSANVGQFVGFPGLLAFRATVVDTPAKSDDTTASCLEDSLSAIVLLPVSGTLHSSLRYNQSSCVSDRQAVVLGDTVKPGDILRVFSPWSCIPSQGGSRPTLFHSFFWVERVRDRDLPSWLPILDSWDSSLPNEPSRVSCSCYASGCKSDTLSCPKRFRDPLDIYEELPGQILPPNLDKNCVLVVHCCKFWLLQKVRLAYLVQFYSGDAALIFLPNLPESNENVQPSKQTAGYLQQRLEEPRTGGIYSVHGLLQLPVNHLSPSFVDATNRYLMLFERQLSTRSARKFSAFRSGSCTFPGNAETRTNQAEFSLLDARIARFRLVEANWIEYHTCSLYQSIIPACSRCQITGSLLFEIPDGSLLISEERDRLCSSMHLPTVSSETLLDSMRKATRLFYLHTHRTDMHNVLPCICLPSVLSPCQLLEMMNPSTVDTEHNSSVTHCFGSALRIEQALVGQNFLTLDWFTVMELEQAVYHGRRSKANATCHLGKLVRSNSVLVDSLACLESLRLYDLVHFSGVIACVDTTRSHTWPVCIRCFSSNLKVDRGDRGGSVLLQCQGCHTRMSRPKQLFEVEVTVGLDTAQRRGLPDPLCGPGPQIVLNLSTSRIFRLLGLSALELTETTQINPKAMLYKRVDDVFGLVFRCRSEGEHASCTARTSAYKPVLVVELEGCEC